MFSLGKICLVHSPVRCAMEFLVKFIIFPSAKGCLLEGSQNCCDITYSTKTNHVKFRQK